MAYVSTAEDLSLHGVRVLGFGPQSRITARFALEPDMVDEALGDFEAYGWVQKTSFGDTSGWSLTEAGRRENERRLSLELDAAGARERVGDIHRRFVPLNHRFTEACTRWQIRPSREDPIAFNDHTDWRWDERVLTTMDFIQKQFGDVCADLCAVLDRFGGYAERFDAALAKVNSGRREWVDSAELDSLHTVWIQFHEDLIATLGIPRGADDPAT